MSGRYDRPLTPEQIAAVNDESIDFGDIPELDEGFWERAKLVERQAFRVGVFQGTGKGLSDADEPRTRELRAAQDGEALTTRRRARATDQGTG